MNYENGEKLYIPYGLTSDKEYAKGVGAKQLTQIILITLAFAGIGAIIGFVIGNYASAIIAGILGIAVSYSVSGRFGNAPSVLETMNNFLLFRKEKQHYRYVYRQFQREKNNSGGGFIPTYIRREDSEETA